MLCSFAVLIACIAVYASNEVALVQKAADNPVLTRTFSVLGTDADTGYYEIPLPTVSVCLPQLTGDAAPAEQAKFLTIETVVRMLRDGLTGCWSQSASDTSGACNRRITYAGGFVDGKANQLASVWVGAFANECMRSPSAAATVRITFYVLYPEDFNDLTDPPPVAVVSLVPKGRTSEVRSVATQAFQGDAEAVRKLTHLTCGRQSGFNSTMIEPTGTNTLTYQLIQQYAKDADLQNDRPDSEGYLVKGHKRISTSKASQDEIDELISTDEGMQEWLRGLTNAQKQSILAATGAGRLSKFDLYFSYDAELEIAKQGLQTTYTMSAAIGAVAGVASFLFSVVSSGLALTFTRLRLCYVKRDNDSAEEVAVEEA